MREVVAGKCLKKRKIQINLTSSRRRLQEVGISREVPTFSFEWVNVGVFSRWPHMDVRPYF